MAEILCASCGRAAPPAEESEIRFCPYCGAELEFSAEKEQPGEDNAALLAALKAATLEGLAELRKNLRPRGIADWLLGGTTRWNDGVTARYIQGTRAASQALARNLEREPDAGVARDAVQFLLFDLRETAEPDRKDSGLDLLLAATERGALDFIPLLHEADRAALGARYQATHKKSSLLPVQRDILKLLVPKKRGGET